jgi:hypothetical protein
VTCLLLFLLLLIFYELADRTPLIFNEGMKAALKTEKHILQALST